jgi:hypothetical protein
VEIFKNCAQKIKNLLFVAGCGTALLSSPAFIPSRRLSKAVLVAFVPNVLTSIPDSLCNQTVSETLHRFIPYPSATS